MYTYSYLIADLGLLLIWFALFLLRKDIRKEMLVMSTLFGIAGIFSQYIYTIDWWRPLTITGTRIGIEDFLFGFWVGGISAIIYEELFKKKLSKRKFKKAFPAYLIILSLLSVGILFGGSFYLLKLNSFYSSLIAFIFPTLFIWLKRNDLILDSLTTGLLLPIIGLVWFWIPEYFTPGWVQGHWLFQNLSGIIILKAPLEDLIWGFAAGAYIGPLYEFLLVFIEKFDNPL